MRQRQEKKVHFTPWWTTVFLFEVVNHNMRKEMVNVGKPVTVRQFCKVLFKFVFSKPLVVMETDILPAGFHANVIFFFVNAHARVIELEAVLALVVFDYTIVLLFVLHYTTVLWCVANSSFMSLCTTSTHCEMMWVGVG